MGLYSDLLPAKTREALISLVSIGSQQRGFLVLVPAAAYATPMRGSRRSRYVSKLTQCLTSTETTRCIRDGEMGAKGVWRWGKKEIINLSPRCHHQNDSCIKMGSDKSHFNV